MIIPKLNQNLLRSAWYATSFDPEKRAEIFNREYKQILSDFIARIEAQDINNEQKEECFNYWSNRLKNDSEKYLLAESRCMSAMVVGPAKFPVARQQKRHESAEKALDALVYTQNKIQCGDIFKRYMTEEQIHNQIDEKSLKLIMWDVEEFVKYKLKGLTLDSTDWTFNAFPHLKGKFTTQAKNGCFAICEKVLEELKSHLDKGLKIQKNIDILQGILDEYKNKKTEEKQSKEYEINGVEIVENTRDDRLQLYFDGKPEQEMINNLKKNGFRWSPKNKAWQRQLTDNARYALKRIFEE